MNFFTHDDYDDYSYIQGNHGPRRYPRNPEGRRGPQELLSIPLEDFTADITEQQMQHYQDRNMSNTYRGNWDAGPEAYDRSNDGRKFVPRRFRGEKMPSWRSHPYQPENSFNKFSRRGNFRGRGASNSNTRPYQSENRRYPDDSQPKMFNDRSDETRERNYRGRGVPNCSSRSENEREHEVYKSKSFVRGQSRPETSSGSKDFKDSGRFGSHNQSIETRNLNNRQYRDENFNTNQEKDSSTFENGKKLESTLADSVQKRSTNESESSKVNTSPKTKLKLKRNHENIAEYAIISKQQRHSVDKEVENQSRLENNENNESSKVNTSPKTKLKLKRNQENILEDTIINLSTFENGKKFESTSADSVHKRSTNESESSKVDTSPKTKLKLKRNHENIVEDTIVSKQKRHSLDKEVENQNRLEKNEKNESSKVDTSPKTKLKLKRNHKNILEDTMISKQKRPSVDKEIENQSRLEYNEEIVKQNWIINKEVIFKQRLSTNEEERNDKQSSPNIEESNKFVNEEEALNEKEVPIKQRRSINEEEVVMHKEVEEKDNTQDSPVNNAAISTLPLPTPNIQGLLEAWIKIPRIDINRNMKTQNFAQEKTQSRKKIMNNSIMQLKLLLLECNRKLKDGFKVFHVSNLKTAHEITDAIFCFEKENSRSFFQVKYHIKEFRSYKKINYRTLTAAEFNLDSLYTFFKENEDVERIVICSNLQLDEQSLRKRKIRVVEDKSKGTRRLEVNEESGVFKKLIEKHSCIPKLAEYLDECMRTGKPVTLKGPAKECHTVLMTENVIAIVGIEGRKQIGKLHPKFVISPDNMLKPAIAHLRRHLKSLNLGELRTDAKLILGENFGKESSYHQSQPEILVDKLDIESTMKKFFDKLEFMECENNIDYYILRELGEKFELIHSDHHIKVVKEELFARLQPGSDQTNLFRSLKEKILSCDLSNYQQKKNSMEVKLEFELYTLQNLKSILTQNNKSTIIIKSDFPLMCFLKIQQVVKSLEKYSEDQYFFLDVDDLLAAKDNLLAVCSTPLEHLLVIQTEGANLKSEQLNDCLKCIRQNILNDPKCTNKLVLIQNIMDSSFNFYTDVTEHKEIFNGEAGLTKVFQDKLSETICESYGPDGITHGAALKELILETSDLTYLLASPQCVEKLTKEKVIIAENLVKPVIFESIYTIPRSLKRHVVISSAALKEESQDIFFLYGDEKEIKMNKVHYFKEFNSALSSFEECISQNKKINAHLLKYVSVRGSNQLIWQRSSGSVSSLMKYLIENPEGFHQSEPISDVLACRIMILCGKSGSGKSHYLFELAQRLQSSNQNLKHWVVQLNLSNSLLEQYAACPLSSATEAVDLLVKILGYNELRQRLLHLSAFGKLKQKLSLFVDGLEKLRENNAGRVYQMLHLLRETEVRRIYVTARPEFKKTLEQKLDEFAYNLDSLTRDEQKSFLANTWTSLANQEFVQPGWNDYAEEVYTNGDLLDILDEPLYLNIFALVFWFCVKDGQKVLTIQRIYNIYKEYLDKFLNNLVQSKKEIFDKSFSYYSLESLLHPDDFRKLNLPEVRISEDFAKLNHSSFAEYGAAKWLASLPLQKQITAFNIMEDLAERASLVFIETFAFSCEKFYLDFIQQIGDNRLVVQLFTHHLWDNADDDQKQEFLQEAIRMNRVKLVSELMSRSTEINLPAEFLMQVAVYVVTTLVEDKPEKSHPYWALSEKLLEQVPQATSRMEPDAQLPQLLADFFARGSYEAVRKVFQSIGDRKKKERILHARVDGRKPLEIVNSSALMTDEQRLGISKFLIEYDDSKENVYSVMTAAARHGHVQCFEYFAGKCSEMRSNFLKIALKSNQLEVLRFLLNDSEWTRDYNLAKNHPLHMAVTEGVSLKTLEFLLSYGGVNNRNSNGETALCVAIKAGVDLRMIKFLVEKEADVNAKDKRGLHAWCYAVLNEWRSYTPQQLLELMRFLKNKNCNLRLPHREDHQLTCWIKELQRKLEYLWDPESYDLDDYNGTPRLHTALLEKDLDWFEFLLRHGADPDALDSQNRMALHLAVKMEKSRDVLSTVRLLLRYGAMFNPVDPSGKTPLNLLRSSENATDDKGRAYKLLRQAQDLFTDQEIIDRLKQDLSVKDAKAAKSTNLYWLLHSRDSHGRTLVHRAAEKNALQNDFEKLLQFGDRYGNPECGNRSWLDTRDNFGETVVHVVARLGNHKILQELARKGASLRMKNTKGTIPLASDCKGKQFLKIANQTFGAVQRGCSETLRDIPKESHKYLVKARDEAGRTLLHLAALGRSSVTRILLCEWGANANVKDYDGRTPLHYALMFDDLESAKLLLKAGASIDARDRSGKQPVDVDNQGCKSVEMVNTLNEVLERCWRAKLSATELDATIDILTKKFDLEPSAAVNARDSARETMVHHAAHNHEPELLKALLKHGAMFNACNAAKKSPIDLADGEIKKLLGSVQRMFKNLKVVAWEDEKEACDLEIMTRCRKSGGYTLLHTVLEAKKIQEVKWLMDRGADVNVTNCVGAGARKLAEGLELV